MATSAPRSHTHMSVEFRDKVLARLTRIEGQVRGIARMVNQDRYCLDVLTQVDAVREAVRQVGVTVLTNHLEHCTQRAMSTGEPGARDELHHLIRRFIR